jgi:hypothetical protein
VSLTQEKLKKVLNYDPLTGVFTWLVSGPGIVSNQEAGSVSKGRRRIMVFGRRYAASRLAFFYMTGRWPQPTIDHRDRNPLNNAWDNLQEAGWEEQTINQKLASNNRSGVRGVCKKYRSTRWRAYLRTGGVTKSLGHYDTLEEAIAARRRAEEARDKCLLPHRSK